MKQVEHESTDVRPRHHTRSEPKARQCILGQLDGMGDDASRAHESTDVRPSHHTKEKKSIHVSSMGWEMQLGWES
jgi:hypothetical protein